MVDYGEYNTNAIVLTDSRCCDENEINLGTVHSYARHNPNYSRKPDHVPLSFQRERLL
jgi:hypothetical protein